MYGQVPFIEWSHPLCLFSRHYAGWVSGCYWLLWGQKCYWRFWSSHNDQYRLLFDVSLNCLYTTPLTSHRCSSGLIFIRSKSFLDLRLLISINSMIFDIISIKILNLVYMYFVTVWLSLRYPSQNVHGHFVGFQKMPFQFRLWLQRLC